MEGVVSAVTGDLVCRFISFLLNKLSGELPSVPIPIDNKVKRLQQLLLRVQTVVSEADERYISNSGMLIQLKMIAEDMYRGYHVLDKFFIHGRLKESAEQASSSSSLHLARPLKRCRISTGTTCKNMSVSHELQSELENLETVVANMSEFVIFLGGCDRLSPKPYDAYLYIDNFMFGRHAEKQQVIRFLLQDNPSDAPAILPIVGGSRVGKKTLVAHVCNNERVRSCFSSVLHLNGDNFWKIDSKNLKLERTLVVVVFHSDVNDNEWAQFYSSVTCMGRGSKVIIVGSLEMLVRFGTVKPVHVGRLTDQEYCYLLKTLAFGSANPHEHPHLASIIQDLATTLRGSMIAAHIAADVLRKNIDIQFWLRMVEILKITVQKNMELFGEHPKTLFERHQNVEVAYSAAAAPLQLLGDAPKKMELPRATLGDMLADPTMRPKGEFNLVTWESRIPPYAIYMHHVPSCGD